jgi:Rod binding domain-containing protein
MTSTIPLPQAGLDFPISRAPKPTGRAVTPESATKAAHEVEGFFITMMLEAMFTGIKTDGMFGGGHGEKVFRSMMFEEYGKSISRTNELGLADSVKREILRLQEVDG